MIAIADYFLHEQASNQDRFTAVSELSLRQINFFWPNLKSCYEISLWSVNMTVIDISRLADYQSEPSVQPLGHRLRERMSEISG
jgi:hypothetical protein